ncbi:unnamed protein product, partial [Staurois parvus]
MIPYCPGPQELSVHPWGRCCLSVPPHQWPSVQPISAHQCSLISAH